MTWVLLRIWIGIGLQSFGGGASTLLLIQRAFVEKRHLISAGEMARFWSLCQFTPGINLIALTVLIGRTLGGNGGIVASLAGMLLPSAAVTCALAVGFTAVQHSPAVHAVIHGVVPATAGIMLVVAMGYSRPLYEQVRGQGIPAMVVNGALVVACALAIAFAKLSVIAVVIGAALIGAALFTSWRPVHMEPPAEISQESPLP